MKCLLFALLLTAMQASTPVSRPTTNSNQSGADAKKHSASKQSPSTSTPPDTQVITSDPNAQATPDKQIHDGASKPVSIRELPPVSLNRDWADWVAWILGCVLVAVGISGVLAAYSTLAVLEKQTRAIRRQGLSMRRQTRLLRKSVDAQVNSERPWLLIEIKTTKDEAMAGRVPDFIGFSVSFKNCGKTPAEIIMFEQHPDCRDDTSDLPVPPKYSLEGMVNAHTRIVPAGEVWRDPGESYFMSTQFLVLDQWRDIQRSTKRLIYWGRLQYRDLIQQPKTIHELGRVGTIHETCFCYFWSPTLNEFLICGPLGYNKHT